MNYRKFEKETNGKHVVFGKVIEGMDVVQTIAKYGTGSGDTKTRIFISDCGYHLAQ